MIALQYQRFGEPAEVVAPVELPVPQPGKGEVRLRLLLSPIHNHDLAKIRGMYGERPELPALGGSEMLGVIDAIGAGVTGLEIGTRVATFGGAWAQAAIVRASWCSTILAYAPEIGSYKMLPTAPSDASWCASRKTPA
jgi:NADPH2:quinone reductase